MKMAISLQQQPWGIGTSEKPGPSEKSGTFTGLRSFLAVLLGFAWLSLSGAHFDAGASSAAEPPAGGGGPDYVDFEWFLVQARQEDGRRRNISMLLTLEVQPGGDNLIVAEHLRQLLDAYLRALSSPPLVRKARDRVDLEDVKARIRKANERVLGEHIVERVLIRNINDSGVR